MIIMHIVLLILNIGFLVDRADRLMEAGISGMDVFSYALSAFVVGALAVFGALVVLSII